MKESTCHKCKYFLDVDYYERGGIYGCTYSSRVETNRVKKCNFFKPKAIRKDFEPKKQEYLSKGDEPRNKMPQGD